MDMPQTAIETYSSALINYDELILAERNHLPEIKNDSSRDDSPCLLEEDEDDDFDGEDDGSAEKKKKPNKLNELNGFLGGIHQISKKYMKSKNLNLDPTSRKSERNGRVNEREIEEITRPKDAKRSRLDVEEEDEMETNEEKSNTPCSSTQDEGNLEYVKGQKHIQKLAFAAIEPITIDTTQEVHLILNMYNIQLSMGFPQADRVSLDRLQQIFVRYFQLELRAIEFIANDLPIFSQMWTKDKRNLMYQVSEFFGMMGIRCSAIRDTGALYENGKIIRDTVKKHHFPHLPFVALYDTNKLTPIGRVHREKTCMGRCNNIVMECEVFNGQPCLSLPDVMSKTLDHFKKIDEKRKELDQKANKLVEFIMKMANPNMLITVFSENTDDRSSSNRTPEIQKMLNVLLCDHKIIKGTLNDKAFVDEYYWKEHSCLICDFWCKTYSFKFDAGFSTYHGLSRNKSGVAEWAVYLANHFAPSKKDAVTFEKRIITPFFEQIGDVLHAYRLIALTLAEIVDRFDELSQAQRRITDINVSDFFDQNDNIPEPPIATKRIEFKNHYEAEIKVVIESVRKDVKELRYLMNLMKKQLDGETEDIFDCPICCASIDCFMVFTCGHRICQNCFEKMRALQRRAGSAEDVVACPTCRVVNRSKQVMVAQSGHVQDKSAIPGIILSAKMSEAIILMREILAADPLNKIILFTTIEQTSTQVWEYLTKILKLANLPFIAPTRATCGKKVFDFDVSEDTKVLLCSLSLCANGLNMTGANHIIFLDPPHLQSVLNQAIGRINRFGQKRDMNVYHLLVDGSLDIELRETAKKTYRREDEQKGWTIGDIRSMFGINYYPVQANIRAIVGNVDGNFHRMQEFFRNNIVRRAIP
nr:hypothetical protein T22D1.7 - Caenorhabditis elegans [Caenorhabditis elegans]